MASFFRFFIYSNLFIAACAILMVNQTYVLLLHTPPDKYFLGFVSSATICSYSFHWWLTSGSLVPSPRIAWLKKNRIFHLALFFVGLAGSAIFFYFLSPYWHWLLLSAVITFLYSAPKINHPLFLFLRKIAIGKTIFLAFAWTHVTSLLPVLMVTKNLGGEHILFVINRFFFIYAICIVFDRRDVESDRQAGIKSLITYLSPKGIDALFWASLGVVFITAVLLLPWFSIIDLIILLIPAVIMGLLYEHSKKSFSDYLYYFLLDGLMAASAPILILAKFAR